MEMGKKKVCGALAGGNGRKTEKALKQEEGSPPGVLDTPDTIFIYTITITITPTTMNQINTGVDEANQSLRVFQQCFHQEAPQRLLLLVLTISSRN